MVESNHSNTTAGLPERLLLVLPPTLFIAFFVFVQTPLEIMWRNPDEFPASVLSMLVILIKVFLVTSFVLMLPALVPSERFRRFYSSLLCGLALATWISSTFFFGSYGAFDGRGLTFEFYSTNALIGGLVWFGILLISAWPSRRVDRFLQKGVIVLWVTTGSVFIVDYVSKGRYYAERASSHDQFVESPFGQELPRFSTSENVLHIILDELQFSITEAAFLESAELREAFEGFTLYSNALAPFPTTAMSIPAMLSGEVFQNDVDKEFYMEVISESTSFLGSLRENGVTTSIHTFPQYCSAKIADDCTSIPSDLPASASARLLDLSLLRALPDLLKPLVYREGLWLFQDVMSDRDYEESQNGRGYLLLRDFKTRIFVEGKDKTYKLFHSLITHSPPWLDENCALLESPGPGSLEGRRGQAMCALGETAGILRELKRLDLYDNTLIIVSSDHGSRYFTPEIAAGFEAVGINPNYYALAHATLMLKPLHARGELKRSDAPAALEDLPRTILQGLDIEASISGEDLQTLSSDAFRERTFNYYDWKHEYWGQPRLPPITRYRVFGNITDPAAWAVEGQPANLLQEPERSISCGVRYAFGDPENTTRFTTTGLSGVENFGRWTDSAHVWLGFKLREEGCDPETIILETTAFVNSLNPEVSFEAWLNETYLTTAAIDLQDRKSGTSKRIHLAVESGLLIPEGTNVLKFLITGIASPKQLGLSDDPRRLGLGVISLTIEDSDAK